MADVYPTYGKSRTLAQIAATQTFIRLHTTMQERVKEVMVAAGGKVGLGQGFRSFEDQKKLFLANYVPDPSGERVWEGKRWRHARANPASPPGNSMHELGLAADLVGDLKWVAANAGRFELKTFASVNDEPWHVQPVELPNGRTEYERRGSLWTRSEPVAETLPEAVVPGATGPAVRRLQDQLIRLGLISATDGNRDGVYGPATQEVVRQFQQANGLVVDAKVGPQTWRALLAGTKG
ncbi:MAG TPA: peptidoglycan-binding protein [Ilumatobacteraceae bacterium]|nr:peptidoglycan-binding protein [Ilumatobacteraceae bacterium]